MSKPFMTEMVGTLRIEDFGTVVKVWQTSSTMRTGWLTYGMKKVHDCLEPLKPSYLQTHELCTDQLGGGECAHVWVRGISFERVVSALAPLRNYNNKTDQYDL